jgi:hypothetical protein
MAIPGGVKRGKPRTTKKVVKRDTSMLTNGPGRSPAEGRPAEARGREAGPARPQGGCQARGHAPGHAEAAPADRHEGQARQPRVQDQEAERRREQGGGPLHQGRGPDDPPGGGNQARPQGAQHRRDSAPRRSGRRQRRHRQGLQGTHPRHARQGREGRASRRRRPTPTC